MKPNVPIITLAVESLEKSHLFYNEGLGFETEGFTKSEDHILFELKNGISLVLQERDAMYKNMKLDKTNERSTECTLTLVLEKKFEVDELLEKARKAGSTHLNEAVENPWGYSGSFLDLDGHMWEIMCWV